MYIRTYDIFDVHKHMISFVFKNRRCLIEFGQHVGYAVIEVCSISW